MLDLFLSMTILFPLPELYLLEAPLLLAASQSLAHFKELEENGSLLQYLFHMIEEIFFF